MLTTGMTLAAKMAMAGYLASRPCKVALYTGQADVGPDTPKYTQQGEVAGPGYKSGGLTLRNGRAWADRGSACVTWDSPTIPNASISANGMMIYDAETKEAYFVGAYDGTYTSSEGPFRINISTDCMVIS